MNKSVLSEEQEAIVRYNDGEGSVLVQASAGSGKTRILTERVRYLLTEKKDKFFSVLCLTFTNKAAQEMKDRLVGIPKLSERSFIGNFHEFCLSIVRSKYTNLGFSEPPHIFDETDCKKILEEVLLNNSTLKDKYEVNNAINEDDRRKQQRELLFKCTDFISVQKRKLIDEIPEFEIDYNKWGEKNTLLYQDYNRRLREQNAMDYDDILLYAHRILLNPVAANIYRRTYQYILIDEAQDLNYAQYNIIKTICGDNHKNVLMVGDPKQSIFSFTGSSPDFMQKHFIEDFFADTKIIEKNYRSSNAVLSLAEKIQPNGGVGKNYFDGICGINDFENEETEAQFIASEIKALIEKGFYEEKAIKQPISYKNIAVLARNKFVFSNLIKILDNDEQLKNHYYQKKGLEKFEPESSFFKCFDLGTRVIVNPNDRLHFEQLQEILKIEIPLRKNCFESLISIENSDKSIELLIKYWKHLNDNPKSLGWVLEQLKQHLEGEFEEENEKMLLSFDIKELNKLWSIFVRKETSENQSLANFRYFLALNNTKENKDEITLATVHTTKGLEFEVVFLMGMNEGVFPDYRAISEVALNEEKNNLYVAVTRSKRVLYISYPNQRQMPWGEDKKQLKSRFLNGIEVYS
jgi:DNA helicase-2/ATP-dependent DNA helicase PcrA